MVLGHKALAMLLAVLLSSGTVAPELQQVTTHGGGTLHTNWYGYQSPPWLCFDWGLTMDGLSYTQPLLVRDNVFQLGGRKLYRFDLRGREVGVI